MNKKLVLKQRVDNYYEVIGMENTIEWDIRERLDEHEVKQILKRTGVHKVKVVIK